MTTPVAPPSAPPPVATLTQRQLLAQRFVNMSTDEARTMLAEQGFVAPILWGQDHFSLMIYLEALAVDRGGVLIPGDPKLRLDGLGFPSRLSDDSTAPGHSDADCIQDFQLAGLVEFTDEAQTLFTLTSVGWAFAHALRRLKAQGEDKSEALDVLWEAW